MINYSQQWIDETDQKAVNDVMSSNYLTQGPKILEFEEAIASFCGAEYSVTTNSATSALHLACMALGLGAGDWLWTSPNTFVASSNCALYCGANIDFVDICPETYNLSTLELRKKLETAKKNNKLPKVVVLVHFAGQPCDLAEVKNLSREYGFYIIEDAAHAIGSEYENIRIGSCVYSDITIFSFHAVKNMTTGEGGGATTNNTNLYKKMKILSSHGITRDIGLMEEPSHGPWYYQMMDLGFNYRLTEIQAALGLKQLEKLDNFTNRRNEISRIYHESLQSLPLKLPYTKSNIYSSWHLYVVCLKKETKKERKDIFLSLRSMGIGVNVHYIPVHTQPYYQKLGFKWGDFPVSEEYYHNCLSLPIHYGLTDEQVSYIINSLHECFK